MPSAMRWPTNYSTREARLMRTIMRLSISSAVCGVLLVIVLVLLVFKAAVLPAADAFVYLTLMRLISSLWLFSTLIVFWPSLQPARQLDP